MKNPRPLAVLLIATMFTFVCSCGSESQGAESARQLRLDNGRKWKVNEPTDVGMANMQKVLRSFDASETRDYRKLGESLQAEANTIIRKCDMTGEPHDQLHLVLNPLLEAIGKLASGKGGSAECEAVRKLLQDYQSHFEH